MEQPIFYSLGEHDLPMGAVVDGIARFISLQPERHYNIIIGADSSSHDPTEIVAAVTIWRVGNGAIHFWTKQEPKHFATLRDRIYAETIASITLAQELRGRLQECLGKEIFWNDQIHIDVGERGPTKEFIDAVVGMVRGYGFEAVIKPYSFGASTVADKHT